MELPQISADEISTAQSENSKENIIEIEIPYPLYQYLSTEQFNLHNICRICLSVNDQVLYPLFSAKEHVLSNMIMGIAEIQMSPEDGLPSNICLGCQTEVMNYYEFKMKCVKSDYTLKSVLKGEFVTNEILNINDNVRQPEAELETNESISKNDEADISAAPIKVEENTRTNYLEDIKESMSDEEALCVVQDTFSEKKITIVDSDPNSLLKEIKEITKPYETRLKKGKYQCTFCLKKFNRAKSLKEHMSKRHEAEAPEPAPSPEPATPRPPPPPPAYWCARCKEGFDSAADMKIHNMLHNQGPTWICTECQKEFKGRTALRRHIERHMSRRRFSCARCGAAFVELYALRRHLRVHTGQVIEKKHPCTHCDKRYASVSALTAHMAAHGAERGSVCTVCGAAFASPRLLASHQRVHSNDKPYKCTYCDKRFRHDSTRNTHLRTHTGERPYVCAQCGKAFIQHSNLTLHMRTHTGEKPYSCPMCDRKFSTSSTLKSHIRSHTGERPYSCNICGKRFARVSLRNHMRLHSGERPHACPAPACHKRFNTAHRLREHYRLHTGERPYECAKCANKFTTKSQLMKHVNKHEKKKKASKKGVMLMPVTVSDKNIRLANSQVQNPDQFMFLDINELAPNGNQANLCTVHETPIKPSERVVYQNDDDFKTEVIVLDSNPNLVANSVSYVNDVNYTNDVNLVTVNEGEVSISAASATVDGTTVKLYQYDQSLLQIHTGGGQLTISRISSKNVTANF